MKNIMIFGDSYSTFAGYIPEGYAVYYSENERPETDVRHVEQTWWHLLCEEEQLHLVRNDSWSGSTVCYTGYQGDCSKTSSFLCRLERLYQAGFFDRHTVDTVLIFGCTNDHWANAPLGELQFDNYQHADLFSVRPAIGCFVSRLKEILPQARILFLINTDLKPEIVDAILQVSRYHQTEALELFRIDKRSGHPTVQGMMDIKNQVQAYLRKAPVSDSIK